MPAGQERRPGDRPSGKGWLIAVLVMVTALLVGSVGVVSQREPSEIEPARGTVGRMDEGASSLTEGQVRRIGERYAEAWFAEYPGIQGMRLDGGQVVITFSLDHAFTAYRMLRDVSGDQALPPSLVAIEVADVKSGDTAETIVPPLLALPLEAAG